MVWLCGHGTLEEVLTERGKIQDACPWRQRRGAGCGGRGSVTSSPGPQRGGSGCYYPVTATFRALQLQKMCLRERPSNSAASESQGPLHSYNPLSKGVTPRGIGPQCLLGFLSRESYGFGLSMFVSGAPTFLSSCFCLLCHLP